MRQLPDGLWVYSQLDKNHSLLTKKAKNDNQAGFKKKKGVLLTDLKSENFSFRLMIASLYLHFRPKSPVANWGVK